MMNTAQTPTPQGSQEGGGAFARSQNPQASQAEALSALADGEVDAVELDAMLRACSEHPGARSTWHSYHVIGDVLRASAPAASSVSPPDFLAAVQSRLQAESRPQAGVSAMPLRRAPAANDAVFRWRMVAGVASLAAVMAVSWNVLSGAPSAAGGSVGPQMALMQSAPASAAEPTPPAVVLVNTEQGTLIRDARLESLLAEHRQHGGMSALQMPAGFLRDATYEAAPPR